MESFFEPKLASSESRSNPTMKTRRNILTVVSAQIAVLSCQPYNPMLSGS